MAWVTLVEVRRCGSVCGRLIIPPLIYTLVNAIVMGARYQPVLRPLTALGEAARHA